MQGSLSNAPFKLMETVEISPGSCAILEMKFPVPEIIRLADHSITRTARKGLLAEIEVSGKPVADLFEVEKSCVPMAPVILVLAGIASAGSAIESHSGNSSLHFSLFPMLIRAAYSAGIESFRETRC